MYLSIKTCFFHKENKKHYFSEKWSFVPSLLNVEEHNIHRLSSPDRSSVTVTKEMAEDSLSQNFASPDS